MMARQLVCHVSGKSQEYILANRDLYAPEETIRGVAEKLKRLLEGEPLAYVLGEWEFYGLPMKVGEGVLIPRPDTETIIDTILEKYSERTKNAPQIADLCSGSGCIAITLKKYIPDSSVTAIEYSDDAIKYLRENAQLNGADIKIVKGDVLDERTARCFEKLDILVSNPPYLTGEEMDTLQTEVSFEPELALRGGDDGLDYYRKITPLWRNSIKSGGIILYEIGMGQENDVTAILQENGFENILYSRDTAGIIRIVSAEKKQED
jgi:release factor glutamine methyltransferase